MGFLDLFKQSKITPCNFKSFYEFKDFISNVNTNDVFEIQQQALEWNTGRIINIQYDNNCFYNTVIIDDSIYRVEPQSNCFKRLCYID